MVIQQTPCKEILLIFQISGSILIRPLLKLIKVNSIRNFIYNKKNQTYLISLKVIINYRPQSANSWMYNGGRIEYWIQNEKRDYLSVCLLPVCHLNETLEAQPSTESSVSNTPSLLEQIVRLFIPREVYTLNWGNGHLCSVEKMGTCFHIRIQNLGKISIAVWWRWYFMEILHSRMLQHQMVGDLQRLLQHQQTSQEYQAHQPRSPGFKWVLAWGGWVCKKIHQNNWIKWREILNLLNIPHSHL